MLRLDEIEFGELLLNLVTVCNPEAFSVERWCLIFFL